MWQWQIWGFHDFFFVKIEKYRVPHPYRLAFLHLGNGCNNGFLIKTCLSHLNFVKKRKFIRNRTQNLLSNLMNWAWIGDVSSRGYNVVHLIVNRAIILIVCPEFAMECHCHCFLRAMVKPQEYFTSWDIYWGNRSHRFFSSEYFDLRRCLSEKMKCFFCST